MFWKKNKAQLFLTLEKNKTFLYQIYIILKVVKAMVLGEPFLSTLLINYITQQLLSPIYFRERGFQEKKNT